MLSKTERNLIYPINLLLSTVKRKTFESLGQEAGVSGDTISRLVTVCENTIEKLLIVAFKIFGRKKLYLLIDDTLIFKVYSRCIEGTSDNYHSSEKRIVRSLCSVVAMLTDGNIAIPISQKIWTSLSFSDSEKYLTKAEIAQNLIAEICKKIEIKVVIMDGLYATKSMIYWLKNKNISFEMRIHSNRVVAYKGKQSQLKESNFFNLTKGRMMRTIKVIWKNMDLYITALKRYIKDGSFTLIFQVSNYKASARKHVEIYSFRWNIEKFFRTAKQKLGLNDCQARKLEKQVGHILNVFLAYTIAVAEQIRLKLKNVESAIKSIKRRNLKNSNFALHRSRQIFQLT